MSDPWVRSALELRHGHSLDAASALRRGCRRVLQAAMAELDEVRLFDFARPAWQWVVGGVELGLRRFSGATGALRRVEREPAYASDLHTQINVRALRARMLLAAAASRLRRSHDDLDDFPRCPTPAMYGEYLATRAVALAVVGRRRERVGMRRSSAERHEVRRHKGALRVAPERSLRSMTPTRAKPRRRSSWRSASKLDVWDPVVCCAMRSLCRLWQAPRPRS